MKKFEANYDPDAIRQSIERQRDGILEQQAVKQAELEGRSQYDPERY
jgi:hypothetical protein